MPTFDTPEPITAVIVLNAGTLQVDAAERTETTVEVRPRDAAKKADVRAAEQTEVEYANGRLSVRENPGSGLDRILGRGMVDVTVELPEGSRLNARTAHGNIRCQGRLGASGVTNSTGNIVLGRVTGNAEITSAHGWVRAEEIDGAATVRTTTGTITLGTVTGDLEVRSAHGDITVEHVLASVSARTTHGSTRIGEAVRGSVEVESSYGGLEIGVRAGTAAWLDAFSRTGVVRTSMEAATAPEPTEETIEVRARSVHGDVLVHRA